MIKKLNDDTYLFDPKTVSIMENGISDMASDKADPVLYPSRPNMEKEILEDMPPVRNVHFDYCTVRSLGKMAAPRQQQYGSYSPDSIECAASQLAASGIPFSFTCHGNGGGKVSFELGFEGDCAKKASCFLSAAFGYFDCEPGKTRARQKITWKANAVPVRLDTASLDQREKAVKPTRWMDLAAAAVIETSCSVWVEFYPMGEREDRIWIENALKESYETDGKLKEYLKRHIQLSGNYTRSTGITGNGNAGVVIASYAEGENRGSSSSVGLNLNVDVQDMEAELLDKQLQYRIRLLEQVQRGGWAVRIVVSSDEEDDKDAETVRGVLAAALMSIGYSCTWKQQDDSKASIVLPSHLLPSLISFPTRPFVGFELEEYEELNLNPPLSSDDPGSVPAGYICWNGMKTSEVLTIPREEMNRHVFVEGMTGSGKTNMVRSMLASLDDLHYIVVEPVKGDYCELEGIHRYTMNAGEENGLKMNPFWFPPGTSLQYHIDSLKTIIASSFDLYEAMPNILEQCLYRVYANCGWDFITGENIYQGELSEEDLYPTFTSLCDEIQKYLDESRFDTEVRGNYTGALLSRLQSFTSGSKGALLNTTEHISFDDWSQKNVVVELEALADDDDKAIVMGTLLIQYFQFMKKQYDQSSRRRGRSSGGLRHLFVIEEAHHLFRGSEHKIGEAPGSSNHLVNMLNNLLAEIRAYGEGFIIVDQSPSSISASVLKNTAVKIVYRTDYGQDIRMLQSVLLLNENSKITASLAVGEALVRYGSMGAPVKIKTSLFKRNSSNRLDEDKQTDRETGNSKRCVSVSYENMEENMNAETVRLLNYILFVPEREKVYEAFMRLQDMLHQQIIYRYGWDYVSELAPEDYFMPFLKKMILSAAEKIYSGQHCLIRMIRMFVCRMAELLLESGDGILNEKVWNTLEDYRLGRLLPRISLFYRNHKDLTLRSVALLLGGCPETEIVKKIVEKKGKAGNRNENNELAEAMRDLFIIPPDDASAKYLEALAITYKEMLSAD